MKIGILTFHYSINIGSFMQAFCVERLLREWFPSAAVETIDLTPLNRVVRDFRIVSKRFPFFRPDRYFEARRFRAFSKGHLNLSPRCLSMDHRVQEAFIREQQYDAVVCGSDTVWFHSSKMGNRLPHVYYLPGIFGPKKCSIAASADPVNDWEAFDRNRNALVGALNDFRVISVRDRVTADLLVRIGIDKSRIIKSLDPTIMYDFAKDLKPTDEELAPADLRDARKPVSVCMAVGSSPALRQAIIRFFEKRNEFSLTDYYSEKEVCDRGLAGLMHRFRRFDIFITDRFHKSIFPMKLSNALVVNVESDQKYKTKNSKGRDLFQDLDLERYFIRFERGREDAFVKSLKEILSEWDCEAAEKRHRRISEMGRAASTRLGALFREALS